MGQNPACCCSTRGGEKEKDPNQARNANAEAVMRRPIRNDGYCLGSGALTSACFGGSSNNNSTAPSRGGTNRDSRENESRGRGVDPFCSVTCVSGERGNGIDQRLAQEVPGLFGDKSLRPKLMRLRKLEGEIELLQQISAKVAQRAAASTKPLAPQAITSCAIEPLSVSQWAPVVLLHDGALKGVPVSLAVEACASVLGTGGNRIPKEEVEEHYSDILLRIAELARTRSQSVQADLNRLQDEVADMEDLIVLCFEKIDEEGDGYITKERFVAFLCGEDGVSGALVVNSKDADRLFDFMTKDELELTDRGEKKLTFERFKDEITQGGLHVLDRNIELNQRLLKKYRDCAM